MSYSISSHFSFCVTILEILSITESESVNFLNDLKINVRLIYSVHLMYSYYLYDLMYSVRFNDTFKVPMKRKLSLSFLKENLK